MDWLVSSDLDSRYYFGDHSLTVPNVVEVLRMNPYINQIQNRVAHCNWRAERIWRPSAAIVSTKTLTGVAVVGRVKKTRELRSSKYTRPICEHLLAYVRDRDRQVGYSLPHNAPVGRHITLWSDMNDQLKTDLARIDDRLKTLQVRL
jgi:hypothetical protein